MIGARGVRVMREGLLCAWCALATFPALAQQPPQQERTPLVEHAIRMVAPFLSAGPQRQQAPTPSNAPVEMVPAPEPVEPPTAPYMPDGIASPALTTPRPTVEYKPAPQRPPARDLNEPTR